MLYNTKGEEFLQWDGSHTLTHNSVYTHTMWDRSSVCSCSGKRGIRWLDRLAGTHRKDLRSECPNCLAGDFWREIMSILIKTELQAEAVEPVIIWIQTQTEMVLWVLSCTVRGLSDVDRVIPVRYLWFKSSLLFCQSADRYLWFKWSLLFC